MEVKLATPKAEDTIIVTAARARWESRQDVEFPEYVEASIDGLSFYIKRMTPRDIIHMGVMYSRDKDKTLRGTQTRESALQELILLTTVCADDTGLPYFNMNDIETYMGDPRETNFVMELYHLCIAENPDIFTTIKKK